MEHRFTMNNNDNLILQTLMEIKQDVGGLKSALNQHMEREEVELRDIKAEVKKTNGRVTALEAYKNKQLGMATIISLTMSAIVAFFTGHIK